MAFVEINPRYRDCLSQQKLKSAADFLRLAGVIYCGHPGRNVARLTVGRTPHALGAFLKKEHDVSWRERLANAWAGFGFVSKSRRELAMFRALNLAGIPCPDVIAAGEQGGQAFLLIRALDNAEDLRSFLKRTTDRAARRSLARDLGKALARIHDAGFDHPDLYSKHVLVRPKPHCFCFLDWQRSRRRRQVPWPIRQRDLAALDATLADDLAAPRDRLACLHAYLRCRLPPGDFSRMARAIRHRATKLLRKRHIREQRQPPLPPGQQNLIWLDGEALCVTREFRAELEKMPECLAMLGRTGAAIAKVERQTVPLSEARLACLVRRRESRPWGWLCARLRRRLPTSPELEQAATIFRLERFGVPLPRLLAVGQRHQWPWRTESFLLVEPLPGTDNLLDWLAVEPDLQQRRHVLLQAGVFMCRIHEAGYFLNHRADVRQFWDVQTSLEEKPCVVLHSVEGLSRSGNSQNKRVLRDLHQLRACLESALGRTDRLRFLLGYLDLPRLTLEARQLVEKLLGRSKKRRPNTVGSP